MQGLRNAGRGNTLRKQSGVEGSNELCKTASSSSLDSRAGEQMRDRRSTERAKVMRGDCGGAGEEAKRERGTASFSVTNAFR